MNMCSDSDDDYLPLQYGTPSPYKKRKPLGLCSKRKLSSNKKLDKQVEEIMKIEDKYNRKILESINKRLTEKENIYDDQQRLVNGFILNSFTGENRRTPSSLVKDVVSAPLNSFQIFKNYLSPNHYFNQFNQDLLKPNNFFNEHTIFGKLTTAEFLELIKSGSLDIVDEMPEKNELVKFLLYLGSVTENILITRMLSQLLSENIMLYSDFKTIVENWGRVDQKSENNSLGRPQLHNFGFILEQVMLSVKQYTLAEVKDVFTFFINVALDPLLINDGHSILQPMQACIQDLYQKGLQTEQILDLIDHEQWNIYSTKHVVFLLLNCGTPEEIGITLGFRALRKILTPLSNTTTIIDMESLFQIFLTGEQQLNALDLHTFHQTGLLFELIASRISNREKFDVWQIIRFVERIKRRFTSEIKSTYFSEIVNRMKIMWKS